MKTILILILSAFTASAATLYPVMTDNTNRTITGGTTNLALLNTANTYTAGQTVTAGKVSSTDGFNAPGTLMFYTGGSTLMGYFAAAGSHFVGKGDAGFAGSILGLGVDSGAGVYITKSGNNILLSPAATAAYVGTTNLVATNLTTSAMTIGGGAAITAYRSATATLNFASILASGSEDLTITVTGAAVGDTVTLGLPATVLAGAVFNAWVSAADTVTVRCNNAGAIAVDPASATYRVGVTSH